MSAPLSGQSSRQKSASRNPLLYSSLILFCVAAYVVFVLFTRHESARLYEEQNKARQDAQRRADDAAAVEQLGGSDLAIRGFYVSPGVVRPGQPAQLCYDVANATQVALDPPVGAVWPSHSRCLNVAPQKTTTYTLTITGSSGKTASQTAELRVR
jgi:hypothetical protein